ncbi:hypothetical protein HMPREF0765_2474 [Sphingobacterium spiritivorum ATCC 33300]|uniref:Uncharacterized protein n=1 Tax=Sphingobacterium spiritivorum ATCC 33300 TaxID=525372 RepID=C2FYR8_SPHSI|nr:hypothetical protein HMPREF0765_2474 [Sphingobacterium spiritivorum ATCC 33300]
MTGLSGEKFIAPSGRLILTQKVIWLILLVRTPTDAAAAEAL